MTDNACSEQQRWSKNDEADDVCLGGLGEEGQGDAPGAFLAEMDAVIPWSRLLALIEPHYPKAGNGTQPKPMEQMLRIYFMQNWFNLSDPQAEDSLYDIESMRRFAGIELLGHAIPDESTILRFRHLLEQHQLTEQIFAEIRIAA